MPWRDRKLVAIALCAFSSCVSLHTLCRGHQKNACLHPTLLRVQKIELGWRRCCAFSGSLGCRNVCRDRQKIAHASTHQKSRTPTLLHESSLGSKLLSILPFCVRTAHNNPWTLATHASRIPERNLRNAPAQVKGLKWATL